MTGAFWWLCVNLEWIVGQIAPVNHQKPELVLACWPHIVFVVVFQWCNLVKRPLLV